MPPKITRRAVPDATTVDELLECFPSAHRLILAVYAASPDVAMTSTEIAAQLKAPPMNVHPKVSDLVSAGALIGAGTKFNPESRRYQRAYRIKPLSLAAAAAARAQA